MTGSEDDWKLLCVVRGYHVYKKCAISVFGGYEFATNIRDVTLATSRQLVSYWPLPGHHFPASAFWGLKDVAT